MQVAGQVAEEVLRVVFVLLVPNKPNSRMQKYHLTEKVQNQNITYNISEANKEETKNELKMATPSTQLPQTTNELEENLKEQINFLQRSAEYYDNGFKDEAKRMATSLYLLLCNKQDYPSLLSQLRIQEDLQFLDSARKFNSNDLLGYAGLVVTVMKLGKESTNSYVPNFAEYPIAPKFISFESWWNNIIIDDKSQNIGTFSRGELIQILAKQDGGSGVAPTLDPNYVRLSRINASGWAAEGGKPILGLELASMRQITFEFLTTLEKEYSKYFNKPNGKKK